MAAGWALDATSMQKPLAAQLVQKLSAGRHAKDGSLKPPQATASIHRLGDGILPLRARQPHPDLVDIFKLLFLHEPGAAEIPGCKLERERLTEAVGALGAKRIDALLESSKTELDAAQRSLLDQAVKQWEAKQGQDPYAELVIIIHEAGYADQATAKRLVRNGVTLEQIDARQHQLAAIVAIATDQESRFSSPQLMLPDQKALTVIGHNPDLLIIRDPEFEAYCALLRQVMLTRQRRLPGLDSLIQAGTLPSLRLWETPEQARVLSRVESLREYLNQLKSELRLA
jgi:transposase-like protein